MGEGLVVPIPMAAGAEALDEDEGNAGIEQPPSGGSGEFAEAGNLHHLVLGAERASVLGGGVVPGAGGVDEAWQFGGGIAEQVETIAPKAGRWTPTLDGPACPVRARRRPAAWSPGAVAPVIRSFIAARR